MVDDDWCACMKLVEAPAKKQDDKQTGGMADSQEENER